jgi:CspA family cold shock protein
MSSVTESLRVLGQVKWFNNKAGYGFITASEGESVGKDIFIHFSSISSNESQQYKYLVQGEYVEFVLDKSSTDKHEFQATQVSGVKGGKLMCETRKVPSDKERPSYRRYNVRREEETIDEFTKIERKLRTNSKK